MFEPTVCAEYIHCYFKRPTSDSVRFSFFNKQQTAHIREKIIQLDVALQTNALSYMRFTVITDKHVKSHFVLTVTESISQHSYTPLVFHDFQTLPHILHSEARKGTDDTLDKMKFKSYLLKLVSLNLKEKNRTQKLHIKGENSDKQWWGVKSFLWWHHFCMSSSLVLWPLKGKMHHSGSGWLDVPLRA